MRKFRALVVDDSTMMRKSVMETIRQTGVAEFDFVEAGDGEEALSLYEPEKTDLLFVDIIMPKMDGLSFLRAVRSAHGQSPPTILITSEANRERIEQAVAEPGVDAVLIKPVDPGRLGRGLRQIIDSIPERKGRWTVAYGECLEQAVQDILQRSCGLTLRPVEGVRSQAEGNVVFGMISLMGDVQWSVVLGLPSASAEGLAEKFAGFPIPFDSADMGDAIGEITNVIGGQLKHLLVNRGLKVEISLPTVISAKEIRVLVQRANRTSADQVDYDSDVGRLWAAVTTGLHGGMVL